MPSRLGQNRRRRLDRGGARSRQQQVEISTPTPVPIGPPWGGYTPDLATGVADWRDAADCQGLVHRGGAMTYPPGSEELGTAPTADPVTGLFIARDISDTPISLRRYRVTANATLGHLYEYTSSWTNRAYTGGGAGLSGDSSGVGVAQTLSDFAYYPADDIILFTNGLDPVYKHQPGSATYTDFSPAVLNDFTARSVATTGDRIFFFNTSESGTIYQNRIRWTTIGASATLDTTNVGAGSIDLIDTSSEGVAVRPIGNFIACYMRRGIIFLRQTGDVFDPFKPEVASNQRGLLGTFAVTALGEGRHFLIANDGWFYLDDDRRFTEVGLRSTSNGLYHKWKETFYSSLNFDQANRIHAEYDRFHRWIWVLWPSTDSDHPDRLWIYDINTDTVWPVDDIFVDTPNVLGLFATLSDTETYATISTTYATETRAYSDLTVKAGADQFATGDRNGVVLLTTDGTVANYGTTPTYSFESHEKALGRNDLLKTWDSIWLRYAQQGSSGPDVSVQFIADASTESYSITQKSDTAGQDASDSVSARLSGSVLAYKLSGTHPLEVTGLSAQVQTPGGKVLRST